MKRTSISKPQKLEGVVAEPDDMLTEYDFDYRKARPNRYAAQIESGSVLVVARANIQNRAQSAGSALAALWRAAAQHRFKADAAAPLAIGGETRLNGAAVARSCAAPAAPLNQVIGRQPQRNSR